MLIRLLDLTGECISETEVSTVGNFEALTFANRVFLRAFSIGSIEYFREVTAERVREIHTLRSELPSPSNIGQGD